MFKRESVGQIIRFSVVGGTVMVFFVALNWLLGHWMGKQPAFLLAYPPTLALHFSLNKWWTFGCRRTDAFRQISEYLIMAAGTFLIQWAIFTVLVTWTPVPGWFAAGVANAAQMVVTFLVMQRRVFASRHA